MLVIKSSSLGDIVHALPAVQAFAQAVPEAEMDWLVERRWARVLEGHPLIRNLIVFDSHGLRRLPPRADDFGRLSQLATRLRRVRYDAAVDLQRLAKSAFLMSLIRARRRYGFSFASCREGLAALTVSRRASINYQTDQIRTQYLAPLSLVAGQPLALPADPFEPCIRALPGDQASLDDSFPGLPDRPFAAALLGGAFGTKLWPAENWRQVVIWLATRMPVILPWAGEAEKRVVDRVAQGVPEAIVAPRLSLRELIALLSRSRLVIGGDTGPLHLAAGLGRPTISFYGPTLARRNAPPGHRAVQSPVECTGCVKRTCPKGQPDCLSELKPEAVWREVSAELKRLG